VDIWFVLTGNSSNAEFVLSNESAMLKDDDVAGVPKIVLYNRKFHIFKFVIVSFDCIPLCKDLQIQLLNNQTKRSRKGRVYTDPA
jgi:hypothetical protein